MHHASGNGPHLPRGPGVPCAASTPAVPAAVRNVGRHLPALDGARGLAVLCVLLDHASDAGMELWPGLDLNRLGKYGVYLFFVLSAFLLTYPFWFQPPAGLRQPAVWANYFLRRFLRIYPLYLLVLLFETGRGELTLAQLGNHLLLREGVNHFWTIPVEFKFYFVLPLLVFAVAYVMRTNWVGGIGALLGVGFLLAFGFFPLERAWSLDERVLLADSIPAFLVGCGGGFLFGILRQRGLGLGRWAWLGDVVAGGAVVATVMRLPDCYNALFPALDPVSKFGHDPLICGLLWLALLLGALFGGGATRRALEWRPLRYLGLISYSVYLWHRKFVSDCDDMPLPPQLRLVVFVVLVCGVASVTYFLVERPLSRVRLRRPTG